MSGSTRHLGYWIALWISVIFGALTLAYAQKWPDDYLGILSSIALIVLCVIKIWSQDYEYIDDELEYDENAEELR